MSYEREQFVADTLWVRSKFSSSRFIKKKTVRTTRLTSNLSRVPPASSPRTDVRLSGCTWGVLRNRCVGLSGQKNQGNRSCCSRGSRAGSPRLVRLRLIPCTRQPGGTSLFLRVSSDRRRGLCNCGKEGIGTSMLVMGSVEPGLV